MKLPSKKQAYYAQLELIEKALECARYEFFNNEYYDESMVADIDEVVFVVREALNRLENEKEEPNNVCF